MYHNKKISWGGGDYGNLNLLFCNHSQKNEIEKPGEKNRKIIIIKQIYKFKECGIKPKVNEVHI